jgi:hypothetical protein
MESKPIQTNLHFSPAGASRLDRFYLAPELLGRKSGIEVIPAAFKDHAAVVLRITTQDTKPPRPRGIWKMNPLLMNDEFIKQKIRTEWMKWKYYRRYYLDITVWWERCVKKHPKILLRAEQRTIRT